MLKSYKYQCLLFLFILVLFSLVRKVDLWFMTVLILWLSCFWFSIKIFRKNIFTTFFLLTFYVFLLGAYVNYQYFGYNRHIIIFTTIGSHIYISLILAILGLVSGLYISLKGLLKKSTTKLHFNRKINLNLKNIVTQEKAIIIGKWGMYSSLIPYLLIQIIKLYFTINKGYTYIYLKDVSQSVPYLIRLIGLTYPLFFYLFLASKPSKKELYIPLIIFSVTLLLSLFTGARTSFVMNFILIFIYICFRHFDNDGTTWISKKMLLIILILLPIALLLLNFYDYMRFGQTIKLRGILNSIMDVFNKQGFSISVIGYAKQQHNNIPNKLYTIGGIVSFLKYNPISNFLFHFPSYPNHTALKALNGEQFAHIMSYLIIPLDYTKGRGIGSSFIAESYHDFGYIGIFLISFIYGKLLYFMNKFNDLSIMKRMCILLMVEPVLMAPRSNSDGFITAYLKIEVFLTILIIYLIAIYWDKIFKKNK